MGTHPLVSPNSSSLPLAIFAALILEEKENALGFAGTERTVGSWWDLVFSEEGFCGGALNGLAKEVDKRLDSSEQPAVVEDVSAHCR